MFDCVFIRLTPIQHDGMLSGWGGDFRIKMTTHDNTYVIKKRQSVPFTGPVVAHRVGTGIDLHFHDCGTRRGGEWSAARSGRTLPLGKTRYPLYRRVGGPQGRSGQVRKISPPTGIRSLDRPSRIQSLYRLSYPAHCLGDELALIPDHKAKTEADHTFITFGTV